MGLNAQEYVAIMGIHTVGFANDDNQGKKGRWTMNPYVFDNTYFQECLLGHSSKYLKTAADLELVQKAEELPKDIAWHMIGHLQTNKVRFIAPFVSLIHGVDSLKLLKEINKRAEQNNRIIDCLLQVHIASESTKFGFGLSEVTSALNQAEEFKNKFWNFLRKS